MHACHFLCRRIWYDLTKDVCPLHHQTAMQCLSLPQQEYHITSITHTTVLVTSYMTEGLNLLYLATLLLYAIACCERPKQNHVHTGLGLHKTARHQMHDEDAFGERTSVRPRTAACLGPCGGQNRMGMSCSAVAPGLDG